MIESVFSNKLRVRACAIIVSNSNLLLIKHNSPTRSKAFWMPPGGGVSFGETLETALIREVKEETGLIVQPTRLIWINEYIELPYHSLEFYFDCSVAGGMLKLGTDPELPENEQILLDVQFKSLDDVQDLSFYPKFLKQFFQKDSNLPDQVQHVKSVGSVST